MADILREICGRKREHILARKTAMPESALRERAAAAASPRGFLSALLRKTERGQTALIAEIKKASPSHGLIRADFDPPSLARAYAEGGAACLSVLTDVPYFQGDDAFLAQAGNAARLPVLRKDFMLDPYQIAESRALGADCVLLILAALSDAQARELEQAALELGMDALLEVHDAEEMDRALTHLSSRLIGINNRNLKTLEVNLNTGIALAKNIPPEYTPVSESGISSHADVERMRRSGIYCFLVGESLMRQQDVARATKSLLGTDG